MSTRWYPFYQRGNPQLRVFLPNFWLKLIRPEREQPPNIVEFACSMEMTQHDVKNYLEKIYKIEVIEVRTRIAMGKTRKEPGAGYIIKDDDTKLAYVTLSAGTVFEFPDVYPKDQIAKDKEDISLEDAKKDHKKYLEKSRLRPGLPGWYSL